MVNKYFAMFWGRTDVYAKRGTKGGYFPQCNHRWNNRICPKQRGEKINCEACEHTEWTKLEPKKIMEHLLGYKEDGADVHCLQMAHAGFLYLILIIMKKAPKVQILPIRMMNGMTKLMH